MKKLNRKILVVNGVERFFIVDPETDKLSDVLRRNGLTGTKVGCGVGVCGATSTPMWLMHRVKEAAARMLASAGTHAEQGEKEDTKQ